MSALWTVPECAKTAGVSANTVRGWIKDRDLPAHDYDGTAMVARDDLQRFAEEHPGLPAARRAIARLIGQAGAAAADPPAAPASGPAAAAAREEIRALKARTATLSEVLGRAKRDADRLRRERDLWRSRARAHRASLKAQLDLEERADADADAGAVSP